MDYINLIKRSIQTAWKHKYLWVFGFFVAISDGFGGWHWLGEDVGETDWGFRVRDLDFDPAVFIVLGLAVFAVWILFWLVSIIAEGSLIHGIASRETGKNADFSDCLSMGLSKFLRVFGIMLLMTLAVLFFIVCLLMIIIPSYFSYVGIGIALTIMAIPVLIVLIFMVVVVEGWAIRFAVLYDDNLPDSFVKGWNLFTNNVGKTIGVAFSSLLTQLFFWCILMICLAILAVPFIIIGFNSFWMGLIPGIAMGLFIIMFYSAYIGTFSSSVWTLGFMQITGYMSARGENSVVPQSDDGQ
jgi:hypothetical protein